MPLISPIAFGPDGKSLRVNSDLLAAEMAEALHATKIIYLAPSPASRSRATSRHEISVDALRTLLKEHPEQIAESSRSKAAHAIKAIETGTPRVHIVDGRVFDGLLNEIFSNEGVGSLVYGNDYQQIRKATRRDARLALQPDPQRRQARGAHPPHAAGDREEHRPVLRVRGRRGHRSPASRSIFYPDQPDTAEVGSLYVLPFYHNRGIGKKMVDYACLQAKERGAKKVIALSTQSFGFFTQRVRVRGEHEGDPPGGAAQALRGERAQRAGADEEYRVTRNAVRASMGLYIPITSMKTHSSRHHLSRRGRRAAALLSLLALSSGCVVAVRPTPVVYTSPPTRAAPGIPGARGGRRHRASRRRPRYEYVGRRPRAGILLDRRLLPLDRRPLGRGTAATTSARRTPARGGSPPATRSAAAAGSTSTGTGAEAPPFSNVPGGRGRPGLFLPGAGGKG